MNLIPHPRISIKATMLSFSRLLSSLAIFWILFVVGVVAEDVSVEEEQGVAEQEPVEASLQDDADAADVAIENAPMLTSFHKDHGVVALTDGTFEHETQASTGQTTGSWLVAIYETDLVVTGEVTDPDYWSEHHIVLGAAQSEGVPATMSRFGIEGPPAVLFLHQKKVYHFAGDLTSVTWQELQAFTDNVPASAGHDIPPVPGRMAGFVKTLDDYGLNMSMFVGAQVMVVVIGLFVTAVIGASKKPKSETKKGR